MHQTNFAVLALSAFALPLSAQTYTFQQFSTPKPKLGNYTYAQGINDRGAVAGYDQYTPDHQRAFVVRGFTRNPDGIFGNPIIVPGEGQPYTNATGINDDGVVAGYYSGATHQLGFVESGGNFTTIDYQPGGNTWVLGINYRGDLVGALGTQYPPEHGFISVNGTVTQIDVPGAAFTQVSGIAADGSVVGFSDKGGFVRNPKGAIRPLVLTGGIVAAPTGIDTGSHSIVGIYQDTSGSIHGFLYNYAGSDPTDVSSQISVTTIDYPGAFQTWVLGINKSGQIVGWAQSNRGQSSPAFGFIGTPN